MRMTPRGAGMDAKTRPGGLARLVRGCAEHPWRTLGIWFAVIIVIAVSSAAFGGRLVNETSIPGSDSQHAVDLLKAKFPERAGDAARVVFSSDQSLTNDEGHRAIAAARAEAAKIPGVISVGDPYAGKGGALSKN